MSRIRLTLACWGYDRTIALATGQVRPEGIDLVYLDQEVEETFFRMVRHREFDVAEMSLSSYCVSLMQEEPPFIAIPVFPSRTFRHSGVYVSEKSGIRRPEDLAGRRIGNPEFQMTALVWLRGIMEEEYGVDPASPLYLTGGEEQPGRFEKLKLDLAPRYRVEPIGPEKTLSVMLADGEIDALYATRIPSTMHNRPGTVRRLFGDYVAAEQDYHRRTGIFPIMHTVVIRREVYEANRWIAVSLLRAFNEAKNRVYADLYQLAALKTMLPWQVAHVAEVREKLGDDWWPYGLEPNRHVIEAFLRYHHAQGLSRRHLTPDELFAPETLETVVI